MQCHSHLMHSMSEANFVPHCDCLRNPLMCNIFYDILKNFVRDVNRNVKFSDTTPGPKRAAQCGLSRSWPSAQVADAPAPDSWVGRRRYGQQTYCSRRRQRRVMHSRKDLGGLFQHQHQHQHSDGSAWRRHGFKKLRWRESGAGARRRCGQVSILLALRVFEGLPAH